MLVEDQVIATGKVFVTKQIKPTVLQFSAHSIENPVRARLKPKSHVLEYTIEMDKTETGKPEQIKLESKPIPMQRYFVGIFRDGDLYLTPSKVLQLRPSMKFIDRQVEEEREAIKKMNYEEFKELNPNYGEEAKSIKVTARPGDDVQGNYQASIEELKRKIDMEEFAELMITEKKDIYTEMLTEAESTMLYSFDKSEYIEHLTNAPSKAESAAASAQTSAQTSGQSSVSEHVSEKKALKGFFESIKLDIESRILNLFYSCHCLSFSKLLTLFPEYDTKDLIAPLEQVCYLLNGVWIIKSEYYYEKRHRHARNYLLGALQKDGSIQRGELCEATHLSGEMAINMLREICCFDEDDRTWTLKDVEEDESVLSTLGALVSKQKQKVQDIYDAAIKNFESLEKSMDVVEERKPKATKSKTSQSTNESVCTTWFSLRGDTAPLQLENVIQHVLKKSAVHESELISIINYQKLNTVQNNKLGELTDDDVASQINKLCVKIGTLCVLKSIGDTQMDLYRMTLANLMKEQGGKVKKTDIFQRWQKDLGSVPSAGVYTKVMQEVAKSKAGGHWTLK